MPPTHTHHQRSKAFLQEEEMANPAALRMPFSIRTLLFVNFLTLLLSIVVLGLGIWVTERATDQCSSRLQWLVVAIGIAMFVLSLLGFVGARYRSVGLLWIYLGILTILIVVLIIFTVLAFMLKTHGFGTLLNHAQLKDASSFLTQSECQTQTLLNFQKDWGTVAVVSLVVLILLLILYALACSAFTHAMNRRVFRA